jgi:hypothetical protein
LKKTHRVAYTTAATNLYCNTIPVESAFEEALDAGRKIRYNKKAISHLEWKEMAMKGGLAGVITVELGVHGI